MASSDFTTGVYNHAESVITPAQRNETGTEMAAGTGRELQWWLE
jgi:hypothetical protein